MYFVGTRQYMQQVIRQDCLITCAWVWCDVCRVYVDVYVGDCSMLTEFVMYLYVPTWCEINVIIIIIIIIIIISKVMRALDSWSYIQRQSRSKYYVCILISKTFYLQNPWAWARPTRIVFSWSEIFASETPTNQRGESENTDENGDVTYNGNKRGIILRCPKFYLLYPHLR